MAATLATKQDLFLTGKDLQALSKDLQAVRTELKQDVQVLRDEFKQELQLLRGDMARGFAEQQLTLTLRLGSMLAIYTGLLFAGLKLV